MPIVRRGMDWARVGAKLTVPVAGVSELSIGATVVVVLLLSSAASTGDACNDAGCTLRCTGRVVPLSSSSDICCIELKSIVYVRPMVIKLISSSEF